MDECESDLRGDVCAVSFTLSASLDPHRGRRLGCVAVYSTLKPIQANFNIESIHVRVRVLRRMDIRTRLRPGMKICRTNIRRDIATDPSSRGSSRASFPELPT